MRRPAILTFCLIAAATLNLHAQWTEFRGPEGTGRSASAKLPLQWSEDKNVKWKTAVHGRAWSSPVILGRQVWMTTATEDGRDLFAIALDRDSGKLLHDLKLFHVDTPQ